MEFNVETSELTLKHKTLDVRLYLIHDRGAGLSHNSGGRPESWEFDITEFRHNGRLVTPPTFGRIVRLAGETIFETLTEGI